MRRKVVEEACSCLRLSGSPLILLLLMVRALVAATKAGSGGRHWPLHWPSSFTSGGLGPLPPWWPTATNQIRLMVPRPEKAHHVPPTRKSELVNLFDSLNFGPENVDVKRYMKPAIFACILHIDKRLLTPLNRLIKVIQLYATQASDHSQLNATHFI